MITSNKVTLREKNLVGVWDDYIWETDPELAQLDAAPVVSITFSQYLSDYIDELESPNPASQRFMVNTPEGKHIGNCSYYNIHQSRGEAELGIMIGDRSYWNKGYGTDIVTTLLNHIFRQTDLSRIYLKTLESNTRAQKCFQKCGFTPYGHFGQDGYRFVLMEIHREQWQERQTET